MLFRSRFKRYSSLPFSTAFFKDDEPRRDFGALSCEEMEGSLFDFSSGSFARLVDLYVTAGLREFTLESTFTILMGEYPRSTSGKYGSTTSLRLGSLGAKYLLKSSGLVLKVAGSRSEAELRSTSSNSSEQGEFAADHSPDSYRSRTSIGAHDEYPQDSGSCFSSSPSKMGRGKSSSFKGGILATCPCFCNLALANITRSSSTALALTFARSRNRGVGAWGWFVPDFQFVKRSEIWNSAIAAVE
ncbi:hypothetical protein pdam_00016240 [Pocillopora damicornis]|uniref:Uncharacterized protein n=1 Tax=Pocillopora damicornis TaxID=46731 RepID=A0A3M6UH64_POCDA|nr:hypothetical protein pdam_00016240 [Pocillopora damicornis]